MDDAGNEALRDAIQHLHGLRSEWIESVLVRETFKGELVWEGEVQVFAVEHQSASRAYAWSHASGPAGRRKFFVVLGVPPIDSALKAVQASIAGRPRLDPDSAKETVITIRLSREERAAIALAAERAGNRGASEWARRVLLAAAGGDAGEDPAPKGRGGRIKSVYNASP